MADRAAQHEWITPQLVVLVRGRPEESVLWACKEISATGMNNRFNSCLSQVNKDCNQVCDATVGS